MDIQQLIICWLWTILKQKNQIAKNKTGHLTVLTTSKNYQKMCLNSATVQKTTSRSKTTLTKLARPQQWSHLVPTVKTQGPRLLVLVRLNYSVIICQNSTSKWTEATKVLLRTWYSILGGCRQLSVNGVWVAALINFRLIRCQRQKLDISYR